MSATADEHEFHDPADDGFIPAGDSRHPLTTWFIFVTVLGVFAAVVVVSCILGRQHTEETYEQLSQSSDDRDDSLRGVHVEMGTPQRRTLSPARTGLTIDYS
jgi:hypothetical protein